MRSPDITPLAAFLKKYGNVEKFKGEKQIGKAAKNSMKEMMYQKWNEIMPEKRALEKAQHYRKNAGINLSNYERALFDDVKMGDYGSKEAVRYERQKPGPLTTLLKLLGEEKKRLEM